MLLSALCLVTACDTSDDTPKSTVAGAAQALQHNDRNTFLGLLTGTAQAQYQNPAALKDLQNYIDQYGDLSISSEKLLHEDTISSTKTYRTYALEVVDSGEHVLDVQVKCQLNYGESAESYQGIVVATRDGHGRGPAESNDNSGAEHTNPHGVAESNDNSSSDNSSWDSPVSHHGPAEPNYPEDHSGYTDGGLSPHGPAEPTDPVDHNPSWPDRPQRPHRPGRPTRPDRPDRPTHPSQPALSWHEVCRINSIQK
jgi:hypothetical protein